MDTTKYKTRAKRLAEGLQERNPFKIARTEEGIVIDWESYSYDPREQERVYLVTIDGQDTDVVRVRKEADDMALIFDGNSKVAAITSKPLLVGKSQFYFTRDGFLGTIPLNEDTLLAGDVYKPSNEEKRRTIPKEFLESDEYNIDWDMVGAERSDVKYDKDKDVYYMKTEEIGDVVSLYGSKATHRVMQKGERWRKILSPSGISKKKILLYMAAGAGMGYFIAMNWGGA